MSRNIERFVNIAAGATCSAGTHTLGEYDETDPRSEFRLRNLRVAPLQPYSEQITAMLTLPGGIEVGPIDIPFSFNALTPVHVVVSRQARGAGEQTIKIMLADLPDSPNLYSATHLVQPQQAADVDIPDAVVAVTPYPAAATITFKDSAGNVICTSTGPYLVARPRLAKTVSSNSATPAMLFHY
jgi:hypothetical protein